MKKLILGIVAASLCLGVYVDISAAQTTPAKSTPRISQRQKNQRARIREGVASGELTKGEAKELRKDQKEIQAEKKAAKADGVVTKSERKEIRKDQKRASKDIYKEKHDRKDRH